MFLSMLIKNAGIVNQVQYFNNQIIDDKTGIILSKSNTDMYDSKIDDILSNKQILKDNLKRFRYSNLQTLNRWKKIL